MRAINFFPKALLTEMTSYDLERLQNFECLGLSIDSRTLNKGDFFILIGSEERDVLFLKKAIEQGACGVLLSITDFKNLPKKGGQDLLKSIPFWLCPEKPSAYIAEMAALFYPHHPEYLMAVTGTNGKTSVSFFVYQIMYALGFSSAALGTVGLHILGKESLSSRTTKYSNLTTPDIVTVRKILSDLYQQGIKSLVLEASSHGLDQGRLKGVSFLAAAFTNFSQDHLDYHESMKSYLEAKCRLFEENLSSGKVAVLNADIPEFEVLKKIIKEHSLDLLTYGREGKDLRLLNLQSENDSLEMEVEIWGEKYVIRLPLIGNYQAHNVLCALGLVMVSLKITPLHKDILNKAIQALSSLHPPPGRLEFVGKTKKGASVYVDYAHTPDAYERVLTSLRPHTKGRLWILFGCGGERDVMKRSLMGKMAYQFADFVVITDDNPRSEDPQKIRKQAMECIPRDASNVFEIPDREKAIEKILGKVEEGDILLLAGKGHEEGQIIGNITYPFNDKQVASTFLKNGY